jgi:hypothetical protein
LRIFIRAGGASRHVVSFPGFLSLGRYALACGQLGRAVFEEGYGGSPVAGEATLEGVDAGEEVGLAAKDFEDSGLNRLGLVGVVEDAAFEDRSG